MISIPIMVRLSRNYMLEGSSPRTLHTSACFSNRGIKTACPGPSFHRCLYSTQHWKIEIVPLLGQSSRFFIAQDNKDNAFLGGKGWADLLAALFKIVALPKLEVPQL